MCTTCGCGIPDSVKAAKPTPSGVDTVHVVEHLLAENDHRAAHNRSHFDSHGVFCVNLMSGPGAGKTSLLEATVEALGDEVTIAVVEGDLATDNDARRIRDKGVQAIQITTGGACHLDAAMVHDALHELPLGDIDLLFVENVGNLVCPASFDLGQHRNVTLLSVPEGDDKPAKYPVMFRASDLLLISKADLLEFMPEFVPDRARACMHDLGLDTPSVEISSRTGAGLDAWLDWLRANMRSSREQESHRVAESG